MEVISKEVLDSPDAGSVGQPFHHRDVLSNRSEFWMRLVCHPVVELPLLIIVIAARRKGRRLVSDSTDLALRSYRVISSHSALLVIRWPLRWARTPRSDRARCRAGVWLCRYESIRPRAHGREQCSPLSSRPLKAIRPWGDGGGRRRLPPTSSGLPMSDPRWFWTMCERCRSP